MKNCVHVAALVVLASCGMAFAQTEAKMPPPKPKKVMPTKESPNGNKPQDTKMPEAKKKMLKPGDAAPAITVDSFVKGDAVTSFEKGKVYVVEFWATWCPPCLESIPHLTEIQKSHRELTVIGIAASERMKKDGPDERLAKLKDFVTRQGDKMDYRVAYDSKRAMSASWMEAAGQTGIPTAFVVDADGKIAFIGHPLDKDFEPAVKVALSKAAGKPAAQTPAAPKTPK